jgi:hypothetical protein
MKPIRSSLSQILDTECTIDALTECISASRTLAELKGLIRSQSVPASGKRYILLKEAADSCAIDGIFTPMGDIFKAAITTEKDFGNDVSEILRCAATLENVERPITVRTFENLASNEAGLRVMLRTADIEGAPEAGYVEELMTQFAEFADNDNRTDELIKASFAPLVFEIVKPFPEKNGIIGRMVFHQILNRYGLTDGCCSVICASILRNHKKYHELIKEVRETGDAGDWIIFMMKCIREGALYTMEKLFSIQNAYDESAERCSDLGFYNGLKDILFADVYCKNSMLVRSGVAERVTAMKYLKAIEERGILESEKIGREIVFRNKLLYDALIE